MTMRRQIESLLRKAEANTGGYCSPAVTILLAINTLIFILTLFFDGGAFGDSPVRSALWASDAIFGGEVWRLLTATFTHGSVMHWFWNMLMLFIFGSLVERHLGFKGLFLLTLIVALLSNFIHVAFVSDNPVLGFSGVDYAILVAFAAIAPRARVLMLIIPMPAWVLAAIVVGLDTLRYIESGNQSGTAYNVHLTGAACGFLAIRGAWLIRPFRARWQQAKADKKEQKLAFDQAELDRLLAKVSAEGLQSLSKSERNFLQHFSQSQRANQ